MTDALPPDLLIQHGRVIDPARGIDAILDVAVRDGRIAAVGPDLPSSPRARVIDARGCLVLPGMIDTHAHVYQHVTGSFGMNADLVGVRSGVATVVDQGGASPLTLQGFRKFIAEPSVTRVYSFISNYLVGGLMGHRYVRLYGPDGINVRETVRAIEGNRDLVRGIKCHAEVGGYSRWGLDTLKLAKEASRETRVPVYVHLGRLWAEEDGTAVDPDEVVRQALPLLDRGDVIAHPFTKHPGAFVSPDGRVHPLLHEAAARGVRIDIGRGGHASFAAARAVLDAGLRPFTVGADVHGYTLQRQDGGEWDRGYFDERDGSRTSAPRPMGGAAVFSLAQVLNELLALGLGLPEIVAMVTVNAAAMLRLSEELGNLAPGRAADISVLAIEPGRFVLRDALGEEIAVDRRLRPELTVRAGRVIQADSSLLSESLRDVA
ncbi:MAG TPA: amidohydrolase/deacetylase family metallohydrolase [Candidatus Limnocylindrales bacterium]|nr:amidohydrolase/deacetylase family metallohydrolase [Candidatus Limnocylindrales bacterium]